jgi:hypothetical protein
MNEHGLFSHYLEERPKYQHLTDQDKTHHYLKITSQSASYTQSTILLGFRQEHFRTQQLVTMACKVSDAAGHAES